MSKETPNGMIHNNFSVNTTIVGNINAASDIRIDGSLQGNIECAGKVIIGEQSRIQGNIIAANAEINGKVARCKTRNGPEKRENNSVEID